MASKVNKIPPTPALDKAAKHRDEIKTIMSFLEHLTFEKELLLATWQPCSAEYHGGYEAYIECKMQHHLVPDGSKPSALIYEYLGLDEETMEVERLTLLNHIRLTM